MNKANPNIMSSFLIQQHFQFHFPGMHINATHRMYLLSDPVDDVLFPSHERPTTEHN
jgi:hypothetical protein